MGYKPLMFIDKRSSLIDAAPELYEACEVAFSALWAIKARLSVPRSDAEKTAINELQRRMDILSSAMRKARGE